MQHTAPEGAEIPIGQPCAWLYARGEMVGAQPAPFPATAEIAPGPEPASEASFSPSLDIIFETAAESGKARATPRARALAAENGLDISNIDGTGPRGRVQAEDVRDALRTRGTIAAPIVFRAETGTLAVTRSKGGTGTPIVLIHGFASDATSWAPVEAHLKHRPLIRIDLPGHGKSPKLKIANFAALAKVMRNAFDALDLEDAHLVGHSLGGAISLALADTRPRSLSSLTLIAPAGLGPDMDRAALSGICNATRPESLGPWLKRFVANEGIITESYVRLAMAGRSDPNLRAAQRALADTLFPDGVQAFDLRAALDRIDTPTRIIWGKQDAIIPWKHALRAPGKVALHLFDGIGHMPQIELAEEVGKIIGSNA